MTLCCRSKPRRVGAQAANCDVCTGVVVRNGRLGPDASNPDRLRHLGRKVRSYVRHGKISNFCIGTGLALSIMRRTTLPGVRVRTGRDALSRARGLFFRSNPRCRSQASNSQGNAGKQAVLRQICCEQTLTKQVYPRAHGQVGRG